MPTLIEGLAAMLKRREVLAAELSAIDAELEETRAILGVPTTTSRDEVLGRSVLALLSSVGPMSLQDLSAQTGRSQHKVKRVLQTFHDRVEVIGNTNRRVARLRTDDRQPPPYVAPEKPPRELASRTEEKTCEGCGTTFTPGGGTSGRFCSRDCYGKSLKPPTPAQPSTAAEDTATEPPPLRSKTLRDAVATTATVQPERRCSRCCHKFRPSAPGIYICPDCTGKPSRRSATPAEPPELDTVWKPGKDAPSLSGDAPGLGATLSGGTFKSHAGRL